MKLILQDKNKYILKVGVGEDVMAELKRFCKEQGIEAGVFYAIGAAKELQVAWYDVDVKEYTKRDIKQELEIISLLGNIAMKGEEVIVHTHGSFSDENMQLVGGHVNKLIVGGACEIMLEKLDGHIEKAFDEEIGLNLMQ